ncbi:hypothetical protein JDV02_009937 [Purpureocillium takamizusanense]|uniref:Uncharacterized protein n=1 Tax=Purpureocillium takamizusanense TaxID=2060973 RepID=A0A9Q8VGR6_9HYPO|nr:uncharacterized protein JDV02_009937 [Purpureocillium takamizusanense]UNI24169.1 hypothetical protein JDV02_009937 [Purpureocillium takamizusanense]
MADPQLQSSFITRLPPEIRQLVYLELWRSYGLRQHILHHRGETNDDPAHLCHWPCTMPYEVQDGLQEEIEEARSRAGVVLGEEFEDTQLCHDLLSPWINHRACGRRAELAYGIEAVHSMTTSVASCWKTPKRLDDAPRVRAPYFPMLLSCKLVSSECLPSIYGSTTFVFTDTTSLTTLVGSCDTPAPMKTPYTPPNVPRFLFQHARSLELSLSANFSVLLPCTVATDRKSGLAHDAYDFHWLKPGMFKCLSSLNIWIAARGLALRYDGEHDFVAPNQLDLEALGKMTESLCGVGSVALSMPLGSGIEPQDGYVESLARPGVRLWKRGTGDRFHPHLNTLRLAMRLGKDSTIRTQDAREVRVGRSQSLGDFAVPALEL